MSEGSHRSALIGIDGQTLTASVDDVLKEVLKDARCHWCGKEVHADSYQVVAYNGGILHLPRWDDPEGEPQPMICCGCSDACLARTMSAGLDHLKELGVVS